MGKSSVEVRARIMFIGPITRAVGLTMNPHLLQGHLPPSHVRAGDVYEDARIIRIDGRSGLLLEVSSSPVHTPAYVKTSDATDEEGFKLEKKFKEGNVVRVRVLDFRQMEGLAICAVKASAFEESFFTHADVKPGMVVRGKVIKIEVDAAVIQFLGGLKALCPLQHMSEHSLAKPPKKFKVGVDLVFRVLGGKSKRIMVTHKRTLSDSMWTHAMRKEMEALNMNETWEVVKILEAAHLVGSKWVYTIKYKTDGIVDRYKAHLVAKGFNKKYGIDNLETFAHVAKMKTVRVLWL
ncbi:rRNA biogenesis protein RRP5-like [Nymphaea colorata]|uniref:rRNA biogenesis protein RRP5-like n=1 Tax=Nymphaea colorata TaxID=210225 RepID=UPI00129EC8FC|nr:rRNA biogenesis protein RRP5-like [Nymphaea colorata]